MTAGSAASRRVLGWTPVAPLPASSPTRPTGITGRMSAPPETSSPGVCSFRLPQMCGFRLPLTSYRTWDAGRRATPPKMLARARALATHRDDHALLPLPVLALLVGVHVKTLRTAARDGRLPVTYDTRTTFRRLRARATPAAAQAFRRSYYGRTVRPDDRRAPLTWTSVPRDYDAQIRALRRARGLSQGQLATLVGAAHKAVVYQWETRKRTPSPLFWQRIAALHQRLPERP